MQVLNMSVTLLSLRDSLVVSVLDQRLRGRGFESRWLRAAA